MVWGFLWFIRLAFQPECRCFYKNIPIKHWHFLMVCIMVYNTNTWKEDHKMSIVRYVSKKTGRVAVYESTSHYDPETKQSRPIRKYLGTEDPQTGELIPSSGKRGRKKEAGSNTSHNKQEKKETDYRLLAEKQKKEEEIKKAAELLVSSGKSLEEIEAFLQAE